MRLSWSVLLCLLEDSECAIDDWLKRAALQAFEDIFHRGL